MLASSLSSCATVWAELAPSNFLPAGFAGGITWETTVTLAAGGLTALTSTCAFFAIMIPFTLDFLTLIEPLSQLTTAGRFSETIASPPSVGYETVNASANFTSVALDTDAQPSLSAIPGPVEPAPVSAADLPQ